MVNGLSVERDSAGSNEWGMRRVVSLANGLLSRLYIYKVEVIWRRCGGLARRGVKRWHEQVRQTRQSAQNYRYHRRDLGENV